MRQLSTSQPPFQHQDNPQGDPPPPSTVINRTSFGPSFSPNFLQPLQPMYYKLYGRDHPQSLVYSVNDTYGRGITTFYLEHVPPPRTPVDIIRYICHLENISFTDKRTLHSHLQPVAFAQSTDPVEQTFYETREIPRSWRITGTFPEMFYPEPRLGAETNFLVLLFHAPRGKFRINARRKKGLRFAGVVDNENMRLDVQKSLQAAPGWVPETRDDVPGSTKVHYRLFWIEGGFAPIPSLNLAAPIADPSLTFTTEDLIAPRRQTRDYINHIAELEGFHPSRLTMYTHDCIKIPLHEHILASRDGGSAASKPLLVTVEVPHSLHGKLDRIGGLLEDTLRQRQWFFYQMRLVLCDTWLSLTYLLVSLAMGWDKRIKFGLAWVLTKAYMAWIIFGERDSAYLVRLEFALLTDVVVVFGLWLPAFLLGYT